MVSKFEDRTTKARVPDLITADAEMVPGVRAEHCTRFHGGSKLHGLGNTGSARCRRVPDLCQRVKNHPNDSVPVLLRHNPLGAASADHLQAPAPRPSMRPRVTLDASRSPYASATRWLAAASITKFHYEAPTARGRL